MKYIDQEDACSFEEEDYNPAEDPVFQNYLAQEAAQQAAQKKVDAAMKLAEEEEALAYMREIAEAAALEAAVPCGGDNDPHAMIFTGGPVEPHRNKGSGSEDIREVRWATEAELNPLCADFCNFNICFFSMSVRQRYLRRGTRGAFAQMITKPQKRCPAGEYNNREQIIYCA